MGRVIFVTGFKGGVGKTTVAANVASSLRALGNRVLIIDGDFGMRCMDMVLGLESEALFDCSDVLMKRCSASAALTDIMGDMGFSFIPAPMNFADGRIPERNYCEMISELRKEYDYIIIDSCAEMTGYYMSFAAQADEAIIVTLHQSTSVRAAEKTAARLTAMGVGSLSLVVNGYRSDYADEGKLPDIPDIINRSKVRLIGVVPYFEGMNALQEAGYLAFTGDMRKKATQSEAAFLNIARRICGVRVKLFDGVENPKRRGSYSGIKVNRKRGK